MTESESLSEAEKLSPEDADKEMAMGEIEAETETEDDAFGSADHPATQLEEENSHIDDGLAGDTGVEEAQQTWEEGGHVLEESEDADQILPCVFPSWNRPYPKSIKNRTCSIMWWCKFRLNWDAKKCRYTSLPI